MSDQQKNSANQESLNEQNLRLAERYHDLEKDTGTRMREFAITSGNHTLRALILINGGAAIALLAFIGQIVSGDESKPALNLAEVTTPLSSFAWGVAAAVIGTALGYFTNFATMAASHVKTLSYKTPYVTATPASRNWGRLAICFQIFAITAVFVSLIFFVCGMLEVRAAVSLLDGQI